MNRYSRGGNTLIEIVIALAVGGLLLGAVGAVFIASLSAWRRGRDVREAQIKAVELIDVMTRDVRNAHQAPGVVLRPQFPIEEGEPLLAIAAAPQMSDADAAWTLYLFLPGRGEVLRQIVTVADGRFMLRDSRAIGTGVVRVWIEEAAGGVIIEAEVRRGRATALSRATAVPRNP